MKIIMIESHSEEETMLALEFAKAHGMKATTDEHRVLTDDDIAFGFGRKATEAELTEYFLKDQGEEPIEISIAFAKYSENAPL